MKRVTRNTLRDQVLQSLHGAIIAGDLEPGEIYSAQVLGDRLGVSPTPVREAMLSLANDHLVEPVRNRGFRILTISDHDLDEISELRLMLEPPAMRRVVERATDDELEALKVRVDRILAAADDGQVSEFLAADRDFHLRLLELAGNRRLHALVRQLRDQTRLLGLRRLTEGGGLADSAAEHIGILEALINRDGDRAEALMRTHLVHTRGIWAGAGEAEQQPADVGATALAGTPSVR